MLIENIVYSDLPVGKDGRQISDHQGSWCGLMDVSNGVPDDIRLHVVQKTLQGGYNYAAISHLKHMKHRNNRSIIDFADPVTRAAVEEFFFFCKRYELFLDEAPVHVSDTSIVIRAVDHGLREECLMKFDQYMSNEGLVYLSKNNFELCVKEIGLFSGICILDDKVWSEEISKAFARFDVDRNDQIDRNEFQKLIHSTVGDKQRVVFKFMKNKAQYDKEKSMRHGWDSQHLMKILRDWNVNDEYNPEFKDWLLSAKGHGNVLADYRLADYHYCILMPEGDRSLHAIFNYERPDLNHIRGYLQELATGLADLHANKIFHLDVKLLNALRVDGSRIIVIDMDAAVEDKKPAGAKFSSGVLPPEMFCQLDEEQVEQFKLYWLKEEQSKSSMWRKVKPTKTQWATFVVVKCFDEEDPRLDQLPYGLIPASAAIDAWAFGALMFQMISRQPLVPVDADDNLAGGDSVQRAATWTDATLKPCIERTMGSISGCDEAIDLVRKLLKVDPTERLTSMTEILKHSFFQVGIVDIKEVLMRFGGLTDQLNRRLDIIVSKITEVKDISLAAYKQIRTTEKVLLRGIFEKPDVPNCFIILPDRLSAQNAPEKTSEWLALLGECSDILHSYLHIAL